MLLIIAIGVALARVPLSSERLRRQVIASLSDQLESDVDLASLELRLYPRLSVVGSGLVVRHKRHRDVPLISVQSFTVSLGVGSVLRKHVEHVYLEGLAIQIPPGDDHPDRDAEQSRRDSVPRPRRSLPGREVVIDDLIADSATLTILPRDPEKRPKVWRMHQLRLQSVGLNESMPFQSVLTNAVPPGEIDTNGTFGPWNADVPGRTPIQGAFGFDHADLGSFKGIAGILTAQGTYTGTLERLDVNGQTTTPDFMVRIGGHPMKLDAKYHAIVDATNGDTTLEQVDATFLQTSLTAKGRIYDRKDVNGHQVTLDVSMPKARLEDVLQLAVNTAKPTMTGALSLTTHFELPPGDRDVVEKLDLKGDFRIAGGRFTDPGVQGKINTLSGRARGKVAEEPAHVTSDFTGRFTLDNGQLALAPLQFDVPGALVRVNGQYGLRQGSLSFAGEVLMDATVSEAVGGWKAVLLKPMDALFRRDGRTFIPVQINGTRQDPKFGLDRQRVFHKDAAPTTR